MGTASHTEAYMPTPEEEERMREEGEQQVVTPFVFSVTFCGHYDAPFSIGKPGKYMVVALDHDEACAIAKEHLRHTLGIEREIQETYRFHYEVVLGGGL